jgi:phosphate starvation-inducible PhoH-like protein
MARDRTSAGSHDHKGKRSPRRPRGGTVKRTVPTESGDVAREMLGPRDSNLKRVRNLFDVSAVLRGNRIVLEGAESAVMHAAAALNEIRRVVAAIGRISRDEVDRILEGAGGFGSETEDDAASLAEGIVVGKGREIKARTPGQELYIRTMRENDFVFSIGPAGTGKTYLAVAMALSELAAGRVRRIMLARPAVEAGERLGFLPGDMREKVNPYLRPLYDSLQDMMSYAALARLMEQGVIEVVPLAFMRGRTLAHSFVILDEAQNTTTAQMLMFLTRLGLDSRAVVTGDVTQIDLPDPAQSGLVEAGRILGRVEGIGMVHLSEQDIVRHRLVRRIVAAYDADRAARSSIATARDDRENGSDRGTDGPGRRDG